MQYVVMEITKPELIIHKFDSEKQAIETAETIRYNNPCFVLKTTDNVHFQFYRICTKIGR